MVDKRYNVHEVLDLLEEEDFFTRADITLMSPGDGVESEEDSADEDGNDISRLSGNQLLTPAEIMIVYGSHQYNSLDEEILGAGIGSRQRINNKPIRVGYKFCVLADAYGYVIQLESYQGAKRGRHIAYRISYKMGLGRTRDSIPDGMPTTICKLSCIYG